MRAGRSIIVWLIAIVLLTSLMNMFGEGPRMQRLKIWPSPIL